jgi:hypothetical protein
MNELDTFQMQMLAVVRARLSKLAEERSSLALRVHALEADLAGLRSEAERFATEAIQLESLIAFYENGAAAASSAPDPHAASELPGASLETVNSRDVPLGAATRKTNPQWTLAWRDEAVAVLRARGEPVHYRELYRAIAARGFTFGGKSPEASFLASLSREQATFAGVGRGCYWLAGETPDPTVGSGGPKRRPTRPRPIGARGGAA